MAIVAGLGLGQARCWQQIEGWLRPQQFIKPHAVELRRRHDTLDLLKQLALLDAHLEPTSLRVPRPFPQAARLEADYVLALPRAAETSSIAARSASLTISPPSLCAFATLSASVRTKRL